MFWKKTAILMMVFLLVFNAFAKDDEDVTVPVNLNSKLKGLKKPVMPKLSQGLKTSAKDKEKSESDAGKPKDGSDPATPGVKTVNAPKAKTLLDKEQPADGDAAKLVDAVKIEVKDVKPMDPNVKIKLDFKE